MENTPSYYSNIPAHVRYDNSLTANARLLYAEITSLCNKTGYCWATNEYFADLYEVDVRSIQRWISSLEEAEHIVIEMSESNRERHIYTAESYMRMTKMSGMTKLSPPHDKIVTLSIKQNIKQNTPESSETDSQDPEDEEEDLVFEETNSEGDVNTYVGFQKAPKSLRAHANKEYDELLDYIAKHYRNGKSFILKPKQYKALKTFKDNGVSPTDIVRCIETMIEKPFYKNAGWDMQTVLMEYERQ